MPVKGTASSSENSFTVLNDILSEKQKKIDQKFEKIATDNGLYTPYG